MSTRINQLIQQMFPEPLAMIGKGLSMYGSFLAILRRITFPTLVKILHFKNKEAKRKTTPVS